MKNSSTINSIDTNFTARRSESVKSSPKSSILFSKNNKKLSLIVKKDGKKHVKRVSFDKVKISKPNNIFEHSKASINYSNISEDYDVYDDNLSICSIHQETKIQPKN